MSPTDFTERVVRVFQEHADSERASEMAQYMKNQFPFYGIQKPLRTQLTKPFLTEARQGTWAEQQEVVRWLWQLPERENAYLALDLLYAIRSSWGEEVIDLLEELIVTRSWWDTVDLLAAKLTGAYFLQYPIARGERTAAWIGADNFWLQRSALLFQLSYKGQTDAELLFKYIRRVAHSREFFIQKAIGWALRQYSYTNPAGVRQFVESTALAPLSRREALKRIQ